MKNKITGKNLLEIGCPKNNAVNIALGIIQHYIKKKSKDVVLQELKNVLNDPNAFMGHSEWGKLAEYLVKPTKPVMNELKAIRSPFKIFGDEYISDEAKHQLFESLKLPIALSGALMPDAHAGYGLPIGGVLATKNAVIPYGVGVDIGCRMSLSILDLEPSFLNGRTAQLENLLLTHTKFGMKEQHVHKVDHDIFYRDEFKNIPLLRGLIDKAYNQFGTSGGGNHFVEFGIVSIQETLPNWKVRTRDYVGILSHSGSRGLGANIAKHYTHLARKQTPLPKHVSHLAWLDLSTHDGQEYWRAMNLAGDYAKACHEDIHRRLTKAIGCRVLMNIDHHHNFAWQEVHHNEECIVHRKGATLAHKGALGIIPGSMSSLGYIVEGLGNKESLHSASHGAGRLLSRHEAKHQITSHQLKKHLRDQEVHLVGGDVDEAPMAYKDIQQVMSHQKELVKVLGTFMPKVVRMDF